MAYAMLWDTINIKKQDYELNLVPIANIAK